MRLFLLVVFLINFSFAKILDFNSLKADFIQILTNEQNKTIRYSGTLYVKRPNDIVWDYKSPIKKIIYIKSYEIVVYEPELYQAIITKNQKEINPIEILKNAKKITPNLMVSTFEDKEYKIYHKNGKILKISFVDVADNKVEIKFSTYQKDISLDDDLFNFKPSVDIDIIRE